MRTLDVLKRPNWAILKGGYWLNARDLGLTGQWIDKWDSFIEILKHAALILLLKNIPWFGLGTRKMGNSLLSWHMIF